MSLMYKGCHEFCYPSRWVAIQITTSADYFSQSEWEKAWLKHPSSSLLKIWELWNEIGKIRLPAAYSTAACQETALVWYTEKTRSTNTSLKLKFNVTSNKSSTHSTVGKPLDGDGCLCQKGPGKHREGGADGLQGGLISKEKQEAARTLVCHLGLILLELLLLHPRLLQWSCVLQLHCGAVLGWNRGEACVPNLGTDWKGLRAIGRSGCLVNPRC